LEQFLKVHKPSLTNKNENMKKIIVTAFVAIAATFAANAQSSTPQQPVNQNVAEISFDKETNDFGIIPQGTPASYTFIVTNKGKAPLIITNASASCGCTTPEWTKEAIKPGGKGYVKATYNAASPGQFMKTVTVNSNAVGRESVTLTLKGEVKTAAQGEAVPQKKN
jgi:archaellum component FlaG (FlaF/FlaG flagellin family)